MSSRGSKLRNKSVSAFPLDAPLRTNVVIRTGNTGASPSCPSDSQLPKRAASAPSRAAFHACSPAQTQRFFASRPFSVATARIPSRKRECQASSCSAVPRPHIPTRRSANFPHSAFQGALRAAPQSSGDGRRFRRVAARARAGRAASASGENGNFGGHKRVKSPPHPGWPPSEWARGTRYGCHKGRFATFNNAASERLGGCTCAVGAG